MVDRACRSTVLLLVLLSISSVSLLSLAASRSSRQFAVLCETTMDAATAEVENLPTPVLLPLKELLIQFHVHATVPEEQVPFAERLLIDDRAARGPPVV